MIVLDVEQGSIEWTQARLGIATSSEFDRVVTPSRLEYASKASTYLMELLAEWVTGKELETWTSKWAERGHDLEPEARDAYAFERGAKVESVGFIYRDEERLCGCSPDGLVEEDGGLELKCPSAKWHITYLIRPEEFVEKHRMQVQGGLWVTGRSWWDLMSYYPGLPPVIEQVRPDPKVQKALDEHLGKEFLARLRALRKKLRDMGIDPRLDPDPTVLPEWAHPSVDHLQETAHA